MLDKRYYFPRIEHQCKEMRDEADNLMTKDEPLTVPDILVIEYTRNGWIFLKRGVFICSLNACLFCEQKLDTNLVSQRYKEDDKMRWFYVKKRKEKGVV